MKPSRIFVFDVRRSRFGFAVFDGPNALLEWGSGEIRPGGDDRSPNGARILSLLRVACPTVIVFRKAAYHRNLASQGKANLLRRITSYAKQNSISLVSVGQEEIKRAFHVAPRESKYRIVPIVGRRFPELRKELPAQRRAWEPEVYSMIIFDTIAAGAAYFQPEGIE